VLDKQREIWTRKKYQVRVVRSGNGNYAILIDEWQRNELLEFPEEYDFPCWNITYAAVENELGGTYSLLEFRPEIAAIRLQHLLDTVNPNESYVSEDDPAILRFRDQLCRQKSV
jgi:hypothetical protein